MKIPNYISEEIYELGATWEVDEGSNGRVNLKFPPATPGESIAKGTILILEAVGMNIDGYGVENLPDGGILVWVYPD